MLTVGGLDDAMAFNSMPAMNPGATSHDAMAMNHASGQPMGMDAFDQELGFDDALM